MKQIRLALFFAALIMGTSYVVTHAEQFGLPAMADERLNGVIMGIILMWFGNLMPKQGPEAACAASGKTGAQTMRRFAGWAFVIAGLVHAVVWLFAPLEAANYIAMGVVAGTLVLVIGRATVMRAWV